MNRLLLTWLGNNGIVSNQRIELEYIVLSRKLQKSGYLKKFTIVEKIFRFLFCVQVRDAFRQCCCYCKRGRQGSYWVQGDDVWIQKQQEQREVSETD